MKNKDAGVRYFTEKEKEKLIKNLKDSKKMELKDFELDNPTTRYFQLREVQLELDRITCEIGSQVMPLVGVMIKLREWDPKELPKHKEYSDKLEVILNCIRKEHNMALMQVLSSLGSDVDTTFKVVHPDNEGDCPGNDPEPLGKEYDLGD